MRGKGDAEEKSSLPLGIATLPPRSESLPPPRPQGTDDASEQIMAAIRQVSASRGLDVRQGIDLVNAVGRLSPFDKVGGEEGGFGMHASACLLPRPPALSPLLPLPPPLLRLPPLPLHRLL